MKPSLTQITFTISLLGILTLLFISTFPPGKTTPISDITTNHLNKKVKLHAQIINLKTYDNFQVLTVQDSTGKIQITVDKSQTSFRKNQNLTIIGKITQYKNNLQIQAEKIIS